MNAVAQHSAFVIPQRHLLECPHCGGLARGKIEQRTFYLSATFCQMADFMIFRCECGLEASAPISPEGVVIFHLG